MLECVFLRRRRKESLSVTAWGVCLCFSSSKPFMEFAALSGAAQLGSFNPLRTNLQSPIQHNPLPFCYAYFPSSFRRVCSLKAILSTHTPTSTNKMFGPHSDDDLEFSALTALSPLDGRYWGKVKELSPYLSESALIYFRVLVEVLFRWFPSFLRPFWLKKPFCVFCFELFIQGIIVFWCRICWFNFIFLIVSC